MNKNTVVAMHLKDGHNFDWENVKIMDPEKNYQKRLLSEMYLSH